MTPEEQLNKIIEHLSEIEDATLDLNNSIAELSSLHSSFVGTETEAHDDVINQIGDIQSSLSNHMSHTEEMVANLLHPDRIEQLTNFMQVMEKAMNNKVGE